MQEQVYIMRSWCERENHLEGVVQHSPRETYIIIYNFDIEIHVYVAQMFTDNDKDFVISSSLLLLYKSEQ